MKFKIKVKLIISVFTVLTLISCDYIIEKNEFSAKSQTRISINKKEAKLLLKASKNNLDILELCEDIEYVDTQKNVEYLTNKLEETHFEIAKNYNKLAEEKLISIPQYMKINNEFQEVKNINNKVLIKNKLKLILNKTEVQIQLLDTLGNTTDNIEFKVLAIKDTHQLKSNINIIEVTLNKLNQQTEDRSTKKLIL